MKTNIGVLNNNVEHAEPLEVFYDSGKCHMSDPSLFTTKGGTPFLLKSYKMKIPIFKERTVLNLILTCCPC